MRRSRFPWARSLRVRLTVTSMGIVAVAVLGAAVSLVWVLEAQLIAKIRERDRTRAVQEAALAVYNNRFPVFSSLLDLPGLEAGTVVQLIEGSGKILYDSRDHASAPDPGFPRFLAKAEQLIPRKGGLDAQREFEAAFGALESCLAEVGIDSGALSISAAAGNPGGKPLIQIQLPDQALDPCLAALRESFTRISKVFASRAVKSEVVRSWGGRPCLMTGVTLLRADGVTPVSAVVVTSLRDVDRRVEALRNGLVVGVPLLVGLVGVVSWLIVGRSLQPVEAMRREVVAIAHTTLDRRVPEPQARDEVGRLARTMNEMLDRLERAAKAQRQFVSDASHELRSPLASIRAQLEVALAHPDQADWNTVASDTLEESLRMQRLIDELLELARMDEQDPDSYIGLQEILDLDDIVFSEAKRIPNRRVRTDGVSAGRVRGNPDQLRRVLRNLLDNAAQYARSEIRVGIKSVQDRLVLVVEDDGPGIPAHEHERIFDRFVRLEESRSRAAGGAGLGLAVVQGIVVRHGGRITITRAGIGGARFEVSLPTVEGQIHPFQGESV